MFVNEIDREIPGGGKCDREEGEGGRRRGRGDREARDLIKMTPSPLPPRMSGNGPGHYKIGTIYSNCSYLVMSRARLDQQTRNALPQVINRAMKNT